MISTTLIVILFAGALPAQTLAPHFVVEGAADGFPLKDTHASVQITGVVAHVEVTQVYENTGALPLEAVYVFPTSTRAAVTGMQMRVGERHIVARIEKRAEASARYEQARSQGKIASLLHQERPNVLRMRVANIDPGDVVQVELQYDELLVPVDGIYELVYPAVVAPRYGDDSGQTHLAPDDENAMRWDVAVHLSMGMPIADVFSISHEIGVARQGDTEADVVIDGRETSAGSRDFVLRYRLAGEAINAGLLLYPGADESFFLLMVQPPQDVVPAVIPPREYIFVVDVSGSMQGFPLAVAGELMKGLVGALRPNDRFNLLFFSGDSALLSPHSLPASPKNLRRAIGMLEKVEGGGGTELAAALERAVKLPTESGMVRSIIVITDGLISAEARAFELIATEVGQSNVFAFGIGENVNRHLIEGLAHAGGGEPFMVFGAAEAPRVVHRFRRCIEQPALTAVKAHFTGLEVYDVLPERLPDLFSGRPIVVTGKYRGSAKGYVTVSGSNAAGPFEERLDLAWNPPADKNAALRHLWARERVRLISDLTGDASRETEVTALGLKYGLLTAHTSFVAVDSEAHAALIPMTKGDGVFETAFGGISGRGVGAAYGLGGLTGTSSFGAGNIGTRGRGGGYGGLSGKADHDVELQQGTPLILGSLDKEILRRVIRGNRAQVKYCYERELTRTPDLKGKVLVKFVINAEGIVQSAVVAETTMNNSAVESCIAAKVRGWRFPSTPGGGIVIVSYPFLFKPAD